MTDLERLPAFDQVEIRSVGGRAVLSGIAIKYGARSRDLGGFRERVMGGAARDAIANGAVLALEEHRAERHLGTTKNGSLRLIDTKSELRYEVDLPDTQIGHEVRVLAERGDYAGSSFGFTVGTATWTKDEEGQPLRTVTSLRRLRDVGPTVAPAYDATSAELALRSMPSELGRDIEVRSVLEAAAAGRLGDLLGEPGTLRRSGGGGVAPPPAFRRPDPEVVLLRAKERRPRPGRGYY